MIAGAGKLLVAAALLGACACSVATLPRSGGGEFSSTRAALPSKYLYVGVQTPPGAGAVLQYALGSTAPQHAIRGLGQIGVMLFDRSGNLYVAYGCQTQSGSGGCIRVFSAGTLRLERTMSLASASRDTTAMIFDSAGNLYVAAVQGVSSGHGYGDVLIYPPDPKATPRAIIDGINDPAGLALDGNGNLYVGNALGDSVTVYAPGAAKPMRTIHMPPGLGATSVTFDRTGRLWVTAAPLQNVKPGIVLIYAPGASRPQRSLHEKAPLQPAAVIFDSHGDAYVRWVDNVGGGGGVEVYSPGGKSVVRGVICCNPSLPDTPQAAALDDSDRLYVLWLQDNRIDAYAPQSTTVLYTISQSLGRNSPGLLAVGPR